MAAPVFASEVVAAGLAGLPGAVAGRLVGAASLDCRGYKAAWTAGCPAQASQLEALVADYKTDPCAFAIPTKVFFCNGLAARVRARPTISAMI